MKVGVVTTSRADYGIYSPILARLHADAELELQLYVGGMHLLASHGSTVRVIEEDGYPIAARIDHLLASDAPEAVADSMGRGTSAFAGALAKGTPDVLLVLGDRFEMFAAAVAAVPQRIPLAHIHGGETTEGAIDEGFRHALTKLSHLHFASTQVYADRIAQMGEERWRITVSGAPALDHIETMDLLSGSDLDAALGFELEAPPFLLTFHPVTLDATDPGVQVDAVLEALDAFGDVPTVATYPNADTHGSVIRARLERWCDARDGRHLVSSLGTLRYFSLMAASRAMVGNSSSGIIEAASFGLPVVNVGDRQKGRIHGENVLDVACDSRSIQGALARTAEVSFTDSLKAMTNPYGGGHAAEIIVETLKNTNFDESILRKSFVDLPPLPSKTASPR